MIEDLSMKMCSEEELPQLIRENLSDVAEIAEILDLNLQAITTNNIIDILDMNITKILSKQKKNRKITMIIEKLQKCLVQKYSLNKIVKKRKVYFNRPELK